MKSFYLYLFLLALFCSFILGKFLIPVLKSLKIRQFIRKDGPPSHHTTKSQVPTIGGLIFFIPLFIITLITVLVRKDFLSLDLIILLSATFLMGAVGFIDDFFKITKKQNKGVSGWIKLLLQLFISVIIFYLYKKGESLIYILWLFFVIAGASNSYNLTDGLDGLAGSISVLSLCGCCFLLNYLGKYDLLIFTVVLTGAILGFLYYNWNPAKVFMGDTGSLAVGTAIGVIGVITKTELFLILFSTIPILEALSVILQVVSFQFSKKFMGVDKRIFKMAPLHHHFELCGWKEKEIVIRFVLFQAIFVAVGIILLMSKH